MDAEEVKRLQHLKEWEAQTLPQLHAIPPSDESEGDDDVFFEEVEGENSIFAQTTLEGSPNPPPRRTPSEVRTIPEDAHSLYPSSPIPAPPPDTTPFNSPQRKRRRCPFSRNLFDVNTPSPRSSSPISSPASSQLGLPPFPPIYSPISPMSPMSGFAPLDTTATFQPDGPPLSPERGEKSIDFLPL